MRRLRSGGARHASGRESREREVAVMADHDGTSPGLGGPEVRSVQNCVTKCPVTQHTVRCGLRLKKRELVRSEEHRHVLEDEPLGPGVRQAGCVVPPQGVARVARVSLAEQRKTLTGGSAHDDVGASRAAFVLTTRRSNPRTPRHRSSPRMSPPLRRPVRPLRQSEIDGSRCSPSVKPPAPAKRSITRRRVSTSVATTRRVAGVADASGKAHRTCSQLKRCWPLCSQGRASVSLRAECHGLARQVAREAP